VRVMMSMMPFSSGGGANELPDPPWDIAFAVDRNVFRGRVSVQVSIQNVRAAAGNENECE
ncbi:hypothetical protein N8967_02255, partial [Akkermansiaceae bacterium]|nr:hypothetical protein [Akkermansiaceae bacterium]